jgi:hypothetical protein
MAVDTDALRTILANGIVAATHMSLHTADPAGTGANEVVGGTPAYARQPVTWTAGPNPGQMTATVAAPFDVPAATDVAFAGLWDALTGGTYLDKAVVGISTVDQDQLEITQVVFDVA